MNHTIEHVPKQLFPSTYWITVCARFGGYLIDGLYDNKFDKVIAHDWTNGICKNNHHFAKMHGKHKLPCEPHDCRGWPWSFEPDEEDYEVDSDSTRGSLKVGSYSELLSLEVDYVFPARKKMFAEIGCNIIAGLKCESCMAQLKLLSIPFHKNFLGDTRIVFQLPRSTAIYL